MNFRVLRGHSPANVDVLRLAFAKVPGALTVFLHHEGGGELLIVARKMPESLERSIMGLPAAWLNKPDLAPRLEEAAVHFGSCVSGDLKQAER